MSTSINYSLATIKEAAQAIWAMGKDYAVWSFVGDMGAGKTTLISAICQHLSVLDAVSSPTYALVNEYHFTEHEQEKIIYHADWYRLKDSADARNAGMEEILYQNNTYAFIEWANQAIDLLSKDYFKIEIAALSDTERNAQCSICQP
jgi:tRNA threonylcarbamoyladenosine biosynthesis protein TsaE